MPWENGWNGTIWVRTWEGRWPLLQFIVVNGTLVILATPLVDSMRKI